MSTCPFYKRRTEHLRSNEMRPDQQVAITTVPIPWCAHPHSPVPERATHVIGGAHLLRCGGDLAKCQVPPEWRQRASIGHRSTGGRFEHETLIRRVCPWEFPTSAT